MRGGFLVSQLRWLEVPFRYTTSDDFRKKLMDWLGEQFYEVLPSWGYEVREEQIYTSFRIAEALCHQDVLLAEAGSGTGKTFAYLLPAICYARFSSKPVILSSASSLLQEQLAGKRGDVDQLSRLLGLNIDVRVAKDPRNYLCQRKAEREPWLEMDTPELRRLNEWKLSTALGDRAEIPEVSDELWQTVAWDESLACDHCQHRGYCQVARNRLHIWAATDFVVASHDQFFRHLWSKAKRDQEGLPPLLPASSACIFDEGHLLERPAIEQLGNSFRQPLIEGLYQSLWANRQRLRSKLLAALQRLLVSARRFYTELQRTVLPSDVMQRWFVRVDQDLINAAEHCRHSVREAADQVAIETEQHLWTPLETELLVATERLEQAEATLRLLSQPAGEQVVWWEPDSDTLWVLPSSFGTLIGQELLKEHQPLIFTSATLQAAGSFAGMKQLLGLPQAKESFVTTSFQLAEQMCAYLPSERRSSWEQRAEQCLQLLLQNGGKGLVLVSSASDLEAWRQFAQSKTLPFPLLWEGDAERGWLLRRFQEQTDSVLSGTSFWEGVDIPGDALSLVIVLSLPFPEPDPLLLSKRGAAEQAGLDPWRAVDLTAMLIRLRQGYGRLIRTSSDRGVIAVLDLGEEGQLRELVAQSLPAGVPVVDRLERVREYLQR
jgi:ATP-dependent DNA helicase DinG